MLLEFEAHAPPAFVEGLRDGLHRDIRDGETGSGITCSVLCAEIAGIRGPSRIAFVGTAPIAALGPAHPTYLSVLAGTVGPLLSAGVRDRGGLITTAADALVERTPEILGTLRTAFTGAGVPDAEAARRCEVLRAAHGRATAMTLAAAHVVVRLADLEGPAHSGPDL